MEKAQMALSLKSGEPQRISVKARCNPHFQPTKSERPRAPMTKAPSMNGPLKRSIKLISNPDSSVSPPTAPRLSADGIPVRTAPPPTTQVAFLRLQFFSSTKEETG